MIRVMLLRIVGGLVTLLLTSVLVFASTEVLPGDPAQVALGQDATPQNVARLRKVLGLNRPAVQRYADWASGVVLRLDFGRSLSEGVGYSIVGSGENVLGLSVTSLIKPRLEKSAILMLSTLVILIPLSLLVGIVTGIRRGSSLDHAAQVTMLILTSLPEFVLGAVLALVLGVWWAVVPPVSLDASFKSLVLPTSTLVLVAVANTARLIRAGVGEVAQADHVVMARLKGLPEREVIRRYILPNSLGATLQALAMTVGSLAGGLVIVEYLFGYPGMGQGLVRAIASRDFPTLQAYNLLIAGIYVVANLLADLVTLALNPRLRTP